MTSTERNPGQRPNAWLLDFGQGFRAAVGMRVLLQIIDEPQLHAVPCTPPYCHRVVSWQDQLYPVMDMASLLGGEPQNFHMLAIVGYQARSGDATRFGAFLLAAPPVSIVVDDTQSCPLPEQPVDWSKFSLSCFRHQGDAIPVLHLARIFSSPANK